jgi:ABC-type antimicrobial peptide transport system permease subunit
MWYSIRRILQRIQKNALTYFVLALEMAVGITFIVYALNHFYSSLERQQILEQMLTNQSASLQVYSKKDADTELDEMAISYNDYKQIQRISNGKAKYYAIKNDIGFNESDVIDVKVVYTDIGRESFNNHVALYGENLKKSIIYDNVGNFELIKIENQKLKTLDNQKEYELEDIPDKYKKITLPRSLTDKDVSLSDCILLPPEDYTNFESEDLANFMLYIDLKNEKNCEKILDEVLKYLRQVHGESYTYEFNNPLTEYKKSSESLTELSRYFGRMAVVMLAILLIGFTGIVKIFMKKREKELAINMALGASKKILIMELFLEVLSICTLGSIIGIFIGNLLTLRVDIAVFDITFHWESAALCSILGLISTILITMSSIKKISKMKPIELLRSL